MSIAHQIAIRCATPDGARNFLSGAASMVLAIAAVSLLCVLYLA